MLLWMGDATVHELYTAACGLYIIWLVCRIGSVLASWIPLGWKGVAMKFFEWFLLVSSWWIYGPVVNGKTFEFLTGLVQILKLLSRRTDWKLLIKTGINY